MGRMIVKLAEDKYVEWTTVCDAPASSVMTKTEIVDLMRNLEIHDLGYRALEDSDEETKKMMLDLVEKKVKVRLERVEKNGTSSLIGHESARQFIRGNRAGPREGELTLEQIIEAYTYTPEKEGKWPFR